MYDEFLHDGFDSVIEEREGDRVKSGKLIKKDQAVEIPINNYIPRFCKDDYCDSFGMQWNIFSKTQLDSHSKTTISRDRRS